MGKLRVGTAKVCISPPAEMFPFPAPAYMGEGLQIDGIYMDMYVRMLAIDNGEKTFLFGVFEESNGTDALKEAVTENTAFLMRTRCSAISTIMAESRPGQ